MVVYKVMVEIPGYQIEAKISEGWRSTLYKGVDLVGSQTTSRTFKIFPLKEPNLNELAQIKLDYQKLQQAESTGIVKVYDVEVVPDGLVLIMEDFDAISLAEYQNQEPLPLKTFFLIATKLSSALAIIHEQDVIHASVKPQNILIAQHMEAKFWDIGVSSLVTRYLSLYDDEVVQKVLPYISPEQTGRIHHVVDYRTDLYSLGITFYELVTGQVPFMASDPLELIHSHLARTAVNPSALNPKIPAIVSDIILKLLAKEPGRRYQSAKGLLWDLKLCQQQLEKNGHIKPFSLGQQDHSNKLLIPQKLYGRIDEVAQLLQGFERISQGATELTLVTGVAGIGKSALIQEIQTPLVREKGYFISGKFDQLNRNIAYWAITQALQNLILQILSESEERIQQWKEKILNALGENGQIIIDVVPEVELILGPQPAIQALEPAEAKNRLSILFQKFIYLFTQERQPLVMFLDDLQWADADSLQLIQRLLTAPQSSHLYLIGAYRHDEVSLAHPTSLTIEKIKSSGIPVHHIQLMSLDELSITQWLAETFHRPFDQIAPLASLVHQKTAGNPFYIKMFIQALVDKSLIRFEQGAGWQWNLQEIKETEVTDNVVDLMVLRIGEFEQDTQEVLMFASCLGSYFDMETLALVGQTSTDAVFMALQPALNAGMILVKGATYSFIHDRVQEAAYLLIDRENKGDIHLNIGRIMLQQSSLEVRDEKLIEIVTQLNLGYEEIDDPQEMLALIDLNIQASKKAKQSAAFGTAYDYLQIGMNLLEQLVSSSDEADEIDSCWQLDYELAIYLHTEAAEMAYLNGRFQRTSQLVEIVLEEARTLAEKLKPYEVKVQAYFAQGEVAEAIEIGTDVLKQLGLTFPQEPTQKDILQAMEDVQQTLDGREILDLYHLPEMSDPESLTAMRLLSSISMPIFAGFPELYTLNVLKRVKLSIQHGNASIAASAYAAYAALLCGDLSDYEVGYQFGQLAIKLLEKPQVKEYMARVLTTANALVIHWHMHLKETNLSLWQAYHHGLDKGDFAFAATALSYVSNNNLILGKELVEFERETAATSEAIKQLGQMGALTRNQVSHQVALNLMGKSDHLVHLVGDAVNEHEVVPRYIKTNNKNDICKIYIHKLMLSFLYEKYEDAAEYAEKAKASFFAIPALALVPVFNLFQSLTYLALYKDESPAGQEQLLAQVRQNQAKMKLWTQHAPMNNQHRYLLVQAEMARVQNRREEAISLYHDAIELAKSNGYLVEEAIALELTGKFYLGIYQDRVAQLYFQGAYLAYSQWGAVAKLKWLEQHYALMLADLLRRKPKEGKGKGKLGTTAVSAQDLNHAISNTDELDYGTIMKATQAVSAEIAIDKLLETLMRFTIENAGAQRGFLILLQNGRYLIEAVATVQDNQIIVSQSTPIDDSDLLSAAIVRYVAKTGENLLLNNPIQEDLFTKDSYIQKHQPQSILCVPIWHKEKTIGILYLENRVNAYVFTEERLKMLQILLAQAAISITNALLYAEQQLAREQLKQYTMELERSNQELQRYAYAASHDLQEPLRKIQTFGDRLENVYKDQLDVRGQLYLSRMQNAAARMQTLIQDLLLFSRVTTQAQPFIAVDLNHVIAGVLSDLEIQIAEKNAKIHIDQLPIIDADPVQMRQLFQNLLSNALKFSQPDTAPIIKVEERRLENDCVEICVVDNGIGFDEKYANRIFGMFQRLHGKNEYAGTGVGLAICLKILERHKGHISAQSNQGEGATFIITLPIKQENDSLRI